MGILSIFLVILHFSFSFLSFLIPRFVFLRLSQIFAWLLSFIPIHPIDRNLKVLNHFARTSSRPELPIRKVKQRSIYYLFKNIVDFYQFLVLRRRGWQNLIEYQGMEHLTSPYQREKGVIGVCAHLGNWEIGGLFLKEYNIQASSLIFEQLDPVLDLFLNKAREGSGIKLLHQRRGLRAAIRALESGELVTVFADQDGTRHGYFQSFFGLHCSFPRSIELFLKHTEASVVPMILSHNPNSDGYVVQMLPAMEMDLEEIRREPGPLYQRIRDFFEELIMENPEQWLLVYNRFKLRHLPKLREDGLLEKVREDYERAWEG